MTSFTAPTDYQQPEGVDPGEEFDEIATFRFGNDGKMTLLAVDGNRLENDPKKERDTSKLVGMAARVKQMQPGQPMPDEGAQ